MSWTKVNLQYQLLRRLGKGQNNLSHDNGGADESDAVLKK